MSLELAKSDYDVYQVQIDKIWVDEGFNCRSNISRESINELMESIKQDDLLFPIVVQPMSDVETPNTAYDFRLVCGYRRYMAVKGLGWTTVPANIRVGLTDRQARLMNFQENLERKDLNILEEARTIDKLYPIHKSNLVIAEELKRPVEWVRVRRRLLEMSRFVQDAAASGRLLAQDMNRVYSSPDPDKMALEIIKARREGRMRAFARHQRFIRKKKEVQELLARLLADGFHPNVLKPLAWAIGEIDDRELEVAIAWLKDKRVWLK